MLFFLPLDKTPAPFPSKNALPKIENLFSFHACNFGFHNTSLMQFDKDKPQGEPSTGTTEEVTVISVEELKQTLVDRGILQEGAAVTDEEIRALYEEHFTTHTKATVTVEGTDDTIVENDGEADKGTATVTETIVTPENKGKRKPVTVLQVGHAGAGKPPTGERLILTTNFNGESAEKVRQVMDARIDAGMTTNASHFVQQCIDFAINYKAVTGLGKDVSFSVPDDYSPALLKNGYYTKFDQIKLPRCK